MGKLDELFKTDSGEEGSELEILEKVEDYAEVRDFETAVLEARRLKKDVNLFVALRLVLWEILRRVERGEESPSRVIPLLTSIGLIVNNVKSPRYRAILLADMSVIFYHLGDEFSGDLTLKSALNLAMNQDDVLTEIVRNLVERGLIDKAAGALRLVKDREKIDSILVRIAELFYKAGDHERAKAVLKHIKNPFHKALALYYMAEHSTRQDPETAKELVNAALLMAEKINDPNARFEVMLKIFDLKNALEGKTVKLTDLLSRREPPGEGLRGPSPDPSS